MATTYRKTPKGISEIETRAHRLSPRLRSALIMVDGKRTDDDLRALLQQHTDESLRALDADGFIEVVGIGISHAVAAGSHAVAAGSPLARPTAAAAAPAGATAPVTPTAPVAPTGPVTPTGPVRAAPTGAELAALRREVVRAINDQIGPTAESLAIKLERARSADELRPLLEVAWRLVVNVRGGAAAAAFRARFMGW